MEILYQRNLYVLAINLAQKSKLGLIQQNVIYRKYGDHLYQKGDFDGAMQQYLKAIENTEPSQVIRKVIGPERSVVDCADWSVLGRATDPELD